MTNLKVVIADDHELFRQGLESLLRGIPVISKIMMVGNGKEVLELLERESCDLIFMDIRMPELNGIETTEVVRKKFPNIKIIALTMLDDRPSVVRMFKAGANGYLLKNVNFKEVESSIKQVMSGQKYFAREISEALLQNMFETADVYKKKFPDTEITLRENEIIKLIAQGFNSSQISEMLFISEKTVDTHRTHIYAKLGIKKNIELVFYAIEHGLVEDPRKK